MFRNYTIPLVALSILLLLSGCGEPEPIRIGFVGQFSGRRSEVGVSVRNGVQLCADQINRNGGINGRLIQLEVHDNKGDPAECARVINAMIDDGIRIIVGPLLSQMAEVTMESVQGKDVLLLTPTMSTDYLAGKDDNIIRTSPTTNQQGKFLADKVLQDEIRSLAVVYDLSNRQYTEYLYQSLRKTLEPQGVTFPVVLTVQKTGSPQMFPLAQKIQEANPDGVVMCLAGVDAANLSQQLRKVGYDSQLYGVSWSQTDDLIQHGGRAVEGMVLVSTRQYGIISPELARFNAHHLARYKSQPSFAAIRGFDAFALLAKAIGEASEPTPAKIKESILALGEYDGLVNRMKLDEFGDIQSGYYLVRVSGGSFADE